MTCACIECDGYEANKHPVYSKLGLCKCTKQETVTFHFFSMTWPRECELFAPAGAAQVARRKAWLAKQQISTQRK